MLRWGWHAEERDQDPLAREFRVYASPPMDVVDGQVLAVTTSGKGRVTSYAVGLQLDRTVRADAAAGLRLDAGQPTFIRSHTAGSTITMVLETECGSAARRRPKLGRGASTCRYARPDQAPAWGPRVQIVPITDATTYEVVLRMADAHRRRRRPTRSGSGSAPPMPAVVADQLAPLETRPGNESAVVPVHDPAGTPAGRRSRSRPRWPRFPEIRTPEPGAEPVHFPLEDPRPIYPGGRRRERRAAARRTNGGRRQRSSQPAGDARRARPTRES